MQSFPRASVGHMEESRCPASVYRATPEQDMWKGVTIGSDAIGVMGLNDDGLNDGRTRNTGRLQLVKPEVGVVAVKFPWKDESWEDQNSHKDGDGRICGPPINVKHTYSLPPFNRKFGFLPQSYATVG